MRARHVSAVVGAFACATSAADSHAEQSDWQYEFTPYLWAAGLDGTVRVNNRPSAGLGVEQSFSDILEKLDFALMGAFEAKNDGWGLLLDGVYFSVKENSDVSGRFGFVSLNGKAKITQQLYALGGTYRLNEGPQIVDAVGGFRYNSVKWDVTIDASLPSVPIGSRRFTRTEDWVDPYVGLRIQHPVNERWSLLGYADIGGFGIRADSSWQVIAGANYAFKDDLIGKFGYRHVASDYDDDGFTYDMASAGFYFGLGFRW